MVNTKSNIQVEHEKAIEQVFALEAAGNKSEAMKVLQSFLAARNSIMGAHAIKRR